MRDKKIKIIHFHPETKANKGDIAIAQAIEDLLRENLNVKKYTHGFIEHLRKMDYPRLFYIISKHPKLSKFLPQFFPFNKVYLSLRKKQIKKIIKEINKHNLFIIGGGGIYSNFFFPLDERILSQIKIPIVIFSPGININLNSPKLTKEVKQSIKYLNHISKLSSVRDSNTLGVLKRELKKDTTNIGCPSILLTEKASTRFKINPNNFNIGVNIGYHVNSINKSKVNEIINVYKNVINKLNTKKPIRVYYFKHHPKEIYVVKKLKKSFKNLVIIDLPPKEMKYYYGKMNFVISMMLHSCILAFGSGTSFFNFAYNSKNTAFMKDIGKIEDYISIQNIMDNEETYKQVINSINKKNNGNKELFEKRLNEFVRNIKSLNIK